MSDIPKTRMYQWIRDEQPAPGGGVARADLCLADAAVDELLARIAELEAHAEHDEDNMEGLQHALVRANQQYTQARTVRDALAETWGHEVALRLKAEADLAERDQLISLFKDMWANVTEDQYKELMDRWAARAEKGSE